MKSIDWLKNGIPNTFCIQIRRDGDYGIGDLAETMPFKSWIDSAYGWSVLEYSRIDNLHRFVIVKYCADN